MTSGQFLEIHYDPSPVPYKAISFFFVRYVTTVKIHVELNAIKYHSVFKGSLIHAL